MRLRCDHSHSRQYSSTRKREIAGYVSVCSGALLVLSRTSSTNSLPLLSLRNPLSLCSSCALANLVLQSVRTLLIRCDLQWTLLCRGLMEKPYVQQASMLIATRFRNSQVKEINRVVLCGFHCDLPYRTFLPHYLEQSASRTAVTANKDENIIPVSEVLSDM